MLEHSKHQFCLKTLDLKGMIETSFVELGARLHAIKRGLLYEPHWSSFDEFLMEMKISGSMASRLMNIHQKFVLEWGFAPEQIVGAGGWTIVAKLLPLTNDKAEALEWLKKAATLTRTDLGREIAEYQTGLPQAKCKHTETYLLRVCEGCGMKEKVFEDEREK